LESFGAIDAVRVAAQVIARDGISAGAAATANVPKFANAAFALQQIRVAQLAEKGRVAVDVRQRALTDVARSQRQKAAGLHDTDMGDENDTLAIVDAQRRSDDFGAMGRWQKVGRTHRLFGHLSQQLFNGNAQLLRPPLQQDAPIVVAFAGRDVVGDGFAHES
jgi:hypothetical protein